MTAMNLSNIVLGATPAYHSDIKYAETVISDASLKIATMKRLAPYADEVFVDIAALVADTRPTVLPMTWTSSVAAERLLWLTGDQGRAHSTVTLRRTDISFSESGWVRDSSGNTLAISEVNSTILVRCEPGWETWRRWSTVILEDFYRAMRAVRSFYHIDWLDQSKAESRYDWDNLGLRYSSREPLLDIKTPLPHPVVQWYDKSIVVDTCQFKVNVTFMLEFPNPPAGADTKQIGACHSVEEEVVTTTTKKVRRMSCE